MIDPNEYLQLYKSCSVGEDISLDRICNSIIENKICYVDAEYGSGVPWFVIAAIHFRESNQSFEKHLHNGDPLSARTIHVPIGRPESGEAPFSWPVSATDALEGHWMPKTWDIPGCLEFMERYNGLGYRKHGINTPYLWDGTDKYSSGLFVSDGTFDPNKKESRPGCVAILKHLENMGFSIYPENVS